MEILTIMKRIIEVLATEKASIIVTSITHSILLVGLVYTVIHLVQMMFDKEEKETGFEETITEVERLIS